MTIFVATLDCHGRPTGYFYPVKETEETPPWRFNGYVRLYAKTPEDAIVEVDCMIRDYDFDNPDSDCDDD